MPTAATYACTRTACDGDFDLIPDPAGKHGKQAVEQWQAVQTAEEDERQRHAGRERVKRLMGL